MTLADARFAAIALSVCAAASTLSDFRVFLATGAVIAAIVARSVGFLYADTRMVSLCQVSLRRCWCLDRRLACLLYTLQCLWKWLCC